MAYCKFQYFAVGSADALVSLWDVNELACLRTLSRLDWPIRSVSFSYDGKLLASASEDLFIDIGHVETGKQEKCKTGQNFYIYTITLDIKLKLFALMIQVSILPMSAVPHPLSQSLGILNDIYLHMHATKKTNMIVIEVQVCSRSMGFPTKIRHLDRQEQPWRNRSKTET